ncbi:hypothetical protein [Saccharothrix sp. Mg75]|uniref:hypothetical protein n=1 Tax=Saccharothrix sp. Mg75 TaxID=3445357 RepID=UPI003EEB701A
MGNDPALHFTSTGERRPPVNFAEVRAAADQAEAVQRTRAAHTVADNAIDVDDCRELLSMLGLHSRAAARVGRSRAL